MDYLVQKVSYLKGLAEGLGVDESSKEGKLLLHIVDALEDFADVIGETIEDQMDLEEYVNFIDEDLADIEEDIYGEEFDEDDFDFDEFDLVDCCDDEDCYGCFDEMDEDEDEYEDEE